MLAINDPERPCVILALRYDAERTVDSSAGAMDSNLAPRARRFTAPVASEPGFPFDTKFRVLRACGHHGVTFRPSVVVYTPYELFQGGVGFAFGRRC